MADNKIRAEYPTGHALTFTVYDTTDALRGSAGQAMSDSGHAGHYVGTPSPALVALDWVIVYVDGVATYQGQYEPEVSTPDALTAISSVQTTVNTINSTVSTISTTISALEGDAGRVNSSWNDQRQLHSNAITAVKRGR